MAKNSPETLKKRNELRRHWKKTINPDTILKTIKRICKNCKEEKDCHWNYTFTQTGKPEYRAKCIDCHKLYEKKIRKRNRKSLNKRAKERKMEVKKRCVRYLGGSCKECGYNKSLRGLTFHHRNPKDKKYTISQIKDWSWKKIVKELDKCDLLCFLCHMELHDEESSCINT